MCVKIDQALMGKVLKRGKNIQFGYLFGSAAKAKAARPRDVDIAVYLKNELHGIHKLDFVTKLSMEIEKEIKSPVDLVILNSASAALAHQVLKYGRLIFERKDGLSKTYTINTMTRFFDYLQILNFFLLHQKKMGRKHQNG